MLTEKLKEYAQSNIYPFHMPGHKRQMNVEWNPYALDITEIDGFDNLHHAQGIIQKAQEQAAALYGAKNSFFLVNGSTCGNLAAICAVAEKKKKILVARNCHKSVYHALFLQELLPIYVYPSVTECGIQGAISPKEVEQKLAEHPDIAAVVITSPTYDGVVSDIHSIANVVHAYGIPLIVDEAHGAHFGFFESFPKSAVKLGADIVIQSLHKTLPAFTQSAILHLCTDRIKEKMLRKYLAIFQTTSPSYVLMAGINDCIRLVAEKKEQLFLNYWSKLQQFYDKMKELHYLKVMQKNHFSQEEAFDFDLSKILIFTNSRQFTGKDLYDLLLTKYGLQMEMASTHYVVAMTSIMDTQEGFDRLMQALFEIDWTLSKKIGQEEKLSNMISSIYSENEKVCEIFEAQTYPEQSICLEDAPGETAANYIYLYPPGIPLLTPGERITKKLVEDIKMARAVGFTVHGISEDNRLEVVNFH